MPETARGRRGRRNAPAFGSADRFKAFDPIAFMKTGKRVRAAALHPLFVWGSFTGAALVKKVIDKWEKQ